MKKCRMISCVLCIALICTLLPMTALAAGDPTVSKDTTFSVMRNAYSNVTVKKGVTLTIKNWRPDPQGLEIGTSFTVEPGGVVTGGSIIFSRTATCTGLDQISKAESRNSPPFFCFLSQSAADFTQIFP